MSENPITKFKVTLENAEHMIDNRHFYEYAYEYYLNNGEMPYGTAKARDGDPYEWILDRIYAEIGPV